MTASMTARNTSLLHLPEMANAVRDLPEMVMQSVMVVT